MSKTNIPFRPVRGTDETIQNMATVNGYLYMATDTRKTYLGIENNQKILMGNDVGIYYGTKEIPEDNSGNTPNPEVYFNIEEVEGDRLPLVNDLILNIDGCFYRVETVADEANVKSRRLTLQGTGSGGGGTGGSTGGSFNISFSNSSKQFVYSTEAESMDVAFISYYSGDDDNFLSSVTLTLNNAEEPFCTIAGPLTFNETHTINLAPYKSLFTTTNTTVKVAIYDKYGNERSDNIKVRLVTISLSAITDSLFYTTESNYDYVCALYGATSGVTDKKIVYDFYNESNLDQIVYTTETLVDLNITGEIYKTINLTGLDHGIYVVKVRAQATITGTNTVIYSNILTHKMGYYSIGGSPLLLVEVPTVTEQYTNIPVNYLFATDETNKTYTLEIKLNNVTYKSLSVVSNTLDTYNLYFENKGTYEALFTIIETGTTKSVTLDIVAYSGNLPTIDVTRDDLMLYLNPRGKTNNDTDRDSWTDSKAGYVAQLNGFNYSDMMGWLMDDDGTSYLKLASGASLTLPDFRPFVSDLTSGTGMTVELDFEINGILDFDAINISCASYNQLTKPQCGFEIIGNTAYFYSSRYNDAGNNVALSSQTITEGKRIRLSYVLESRSTSYPMCFTYLNGKLSGANTYANADHFEDTTNAPALLRIDSASAQLKIYGIRFYRSALTDRVILNNYTASFADIAERQATYDSNNVFGADNKVDYVLVSAEEYNLQIPYMKLTGGYKSASSDDKWTLAGQSSSNAGLPTGKKDYRLVDVETVYPDNDYFKDYNNFKFVNEFTNGVSMAEAYGQKPTNGGAIMYAQGTSSMEYPVKNLRLRFKKEANYYTVRPDIQPVEIICMKADFMESSGSHNTGAANFVDDLYAAAGMKTPGQEHFENSNNGTIVTCIKGHPCLIFYSPSGEAGTYEYVGKYNLNLDKATPEPFGFDHDDDKFGYLSVGDEYYDIQYNEDGDYDDTREGEDQKFVQEGELVNAIHCFEFLDNNVEVCNFLVTNSKDADGNTVDNYEDTWYKTFVNADGDKVPGWTIGFESRYPEDRVGYHDADSLYPLASWLNELYLLRQTDEATALARFANEYECYLDRDFTLVYYLITEALLMVDSRVKNMMIATWGRKERTYTDLEGNEQTTNNYIFYPIFYDMDTMLGLDNKGYVAFDYYDEDTDPSIFNGQEVLWNFVRDALGSDLNTMYSKLENSSALFTANEMLPYFNDNQANMANEAFYNGDAIYKYIRPFREGYVNDSNGEKVEAGQATYLYAVQGDRSLMREEWLTNRMQFLRGKRASTQFKAVDRITYRLYYPKAAELENDTLLQASAIAVPPTGDFKLTSMKTGYAGVQIGAEGIPVIERFDDEMTKTINVYTGDANGTEAYIYGLSTLSDVGDLSDKYMQTFEMKPEAGNEIRLRKLTLGNPHKDYYNPYWNRSGSDSTPAYIGLNGCTYLEEFNLQNCSTFANELDFSNCLAINTVLLTGSSVNGLILPVNGLLKELRLPTSIRELTIKGHGQLNDNGFSLGVYDYGENNVLIGGEGGKYVNNFGYLTRLNIVDTPINTYNIVSKANLLTHYYLQGINWNIVENDTQYCYRNKDYYNTHPDIAYYIYDGDSMGYVIYDGETYPDNTMLYELVSMMDDEGNIVCIPVLDKLSTLDWAEDGITNHGEALSGTITINIPDSKVTELDIYEKYKDLYPNVTIQYSEEVEVEGAYRVRFYRVSEDGVTDINALEPYFTALTAKDTYTLQELINNSAFINPVKNSTISHTYTFTGRWVEWNSKKTYCQDGFTAETGDELFSNYKPAEDMYLIPIYEENVRQYQVTLYDYDDSVLVSVAMDYSTDIGEYFAAGASENPEFSHAYYNYREYTNEANPDNRWAFKGWQSVSDKNANASTATYTALNGRIVTADVIFYAFYLEENCYEKVSMISATTDFFGFNENYSSEGAQIYLNDKYHYLLQGKITLPATTPTGKPIVSVGNFNATAGDALFTHIYFKNDTSLVYNEVGESAFETGDNYTSQLKVVYLPDTIRTINANAFRLCTNLEQITLNDNIHTIGMSAFWNIGSLISTGLQELPTALTLLGGSAFYNAGPGVVATRLPDGLRKLPSWCFANCANVNISTFGSVDNPITEIGQNAFLGSGSDTVTEMIIYYKNGAIQHVGDSGSNGAFSSYKVSIQTITTYTDVIVAQEFLLWGLKMAEGYTYSEKTIT